MSSSSAGCASRSGSSSSSPTISPTEFPPLRNVRVHDRGLSAVIADDSTLLREGLARLLEEAEIDVVGQARNADELMLKVRSYHPDVAIVDIRMPPTQTDEGIRAAREIRAQAPGYRRARPLPARRAHLRRRAARRQRTRGSATCSRTASPTSTSSRPPSAASPRAAPRSTRSSSPSSSAATAATTRSSELSPREREVLELMAEGRSNQAIGQRLFISPRAVEKHVTSIFAKLRLPAAAEDHRRVLAVLRFLGS